MEPTTMIVIFIVILVLGVLGFVLWVFRKIRENKKRAMNHALCRFLTDQHTEIPMLLKVNENGIVQPPKEHAKFFEKNVKEGFIDPNQRVYIVDERAVVYKKWPENALPMTQIEVPSYTFHIGFPTCINPYTGEMMEMTPLFLANLLNEVWSKVAAALGRETEKLLDLITKAQSVFKPQIMYLLMGGALLGILILGYLVVMLNGEVGELKAMVETLTNPSGTP